MIERQEMTMKEEAAKMTWHIDGCVGECLGCLIEKLVLENYGNQGLAFLRRKVGAGGQPSIDAARYRYLREKCAIVGQEFIFINLPRTTRAASDAAAELDRRS